MTINSDSIVDKSLLEIYQEGDREFLAAEKELERINILLTLLAQQKEER